MASTAGNAHRDTGRLGQVALGRGPCSAPKGRGAVSMCGSAARARPAPTAPQPINGRSRLSQRSDCARTRRGGRIEDVVVDTLVRGQGIAALLTNETLRIAREAGARTVGLTSRPDRTAANRLYERLGFRTRESAVYRFAVEPAR
ncbi:GNAT family N-acetyltransferase [Streptomyces hokutonensis]|uniref:GNAT family N-acetyltransferase n=1 Tax=Streptomyces hokutonensis TaxID=1306990 RepID=UPI0033DBEDB3